MAKNLLAAFFVLLAAVFGTLAFLGNFANTHLVHSTGFLALTSPIAQDPEVKAGLKQNAKNLLTEQVDLGFLQSGWEGVVSQGTDSFLESEAYQEIWDLSMQGIHRDLIETGRAEVSINLRPLWDSVADPINDLLPFGIEIPAPSVALLSIGSIDASWMQQIKILAQSTWIFAIAGLVCLLGAVVIARHKIQILTMAAGVTAVIAGGIWWLGAAGQGQMVQLLFGQNYQSELLTQNPNIGSSTDLANLISTHIIAAVLEVFSYTVESSLPAITISAAVLTLVLMVLSFALPKPAPRAG